MRHAFDGAVGRNGRRETERRKSINTAARSPWRNEMRAAITAVQLEVVGEGAGRERR